MKKLIIVLIALFCSNQTFSQTVGNSTEYNGINSLSFLPDDSNNKEISKEISKYRTKEFIINNLIGTTNSDVIKFEIERLVSDNDNGLVSVAFNCNAINEKGLLLAFFGNNKDSFGNIRSAYAFKYIPLEEARDLLNRIDLVKEENKKYLSADDVNNVYLEYDDIKFVFYKEGGVNMRVFWNGFELIWESSAFDKTKKRLDKWFVSE